MATLYDGSIGTKGYPNDWKWYFKITSSETDDEYTVSITSYLQGVWAFDLDLMEKDIWWTMTFDGTNYEVFRVYRSSGQYQTLSANTKYGNKTVTKTYSKSTSAVNKSVSFNIIGSATEYTNMLGTEKNGTVEFTIPAKPIEYKPPSNLVMSASDHTVDSFTISATWTAGVQADGLAYITANGQTKTIDNDPVTFNDLASNTSYEVIGKLSENSHKSETYDTKTLTVWTKPIAEPPGLVLKDGSESNTIIATGSAQVKSDYDQYSFMLTLNDGTIKQNWTAYSSTNSYTFTGLSPNTNYIVKVKIKNTSSGFESVEKSANKTTWNASLTNLKVNLVDKWYWYLKINCSFDTYNGTITKYEFSIGEDQSLVTTTGNSHNRGTTSSTGTGKLSSNTSYLCKVKLTDNHDRTYEASASFKTLDERCIYVNGQLRELKVIRPNGTVNTITPNLLSVIKSDGTVVNMNKIINNDDRTEY